MQCDMQRRKCPWRQPWHFCRHEKVEVFSHKSVRAFMYKQRRRWDGTWMQSSFGFNSNQSFKIDWLVPQTNTTSEMKTILCEWILNTAYLLRWGHISMPRCPGRVRIKVNYSPRHTHKVLRHTHSNQTKVRMCPNKRTTVWLRSSFCNLSVSRQNNNEKKQNTRWNERCAMRGRRTPNTPHWGRYRGGDMRLKTNTRHYVQNN